MNIQNLSKIYNAEDGTEIDKLCLSFAEEISRHVSNPADLTILLREINNVRNQANDSTRTTEIGISYRGCLE